MDTMLHFQSPLPPFLCIFEGEERIQIFCHFKINTIKCTVYSLSNQLIFQNMFVPIQGKISKARETDAILEK